MTPDKPQGPPNQLERHVVPWWVVLLAGIVALGGVFALASVAWVLS